LATFPTALYLSAGAHHEILPVLASDALLLPTGVRLSAAGRDLDWGAEPGDTVTIGRSGIWLPGWRIRCVREWRPSRVRAVPDLAHAALLAELAAILSRHVPTPELMDQATEVCRAARCGDDAEVRRRTRELIGSGQGLTPSGDDALCAVLLVLCGLGDPAPIALMGAAIQEQWTRTTSLSASLLDAARKGYAVPEVATLVEATLRGDVAEARDALAATLAIGHSSGPDLVAGLAGSLRALATLTLTHHHTHTHTHTRPNTAPAPFEAVKGLKTVPARCSDRRFATHSTERGNP